MTASKKLSGWLQRKGGTGVNFGKTQYIAHITGLHDKYNFDRNFISKKISSSYSGKTGKKAVRAEELEEGEIYEIRYDSWNNKNQRFVRVTELEIDDTGEDKTVEISTESLDEIDVEKEFEQDEKQPVDA